MNISVAIRNILRSDNPLSKIALAGYRATIPGRYYVPKLLTVPGWIAASREITNFTYELTEQNLSYLAATVSFVTGASLTEIETFLSEPTRDEALLHHIQLTTAASRKRNVSDPIPRFGRRLGWYAFVRAMKPKLVVETGIDKGLGSVLICSALLRNATEGFEGAYYGTDLNPEAGFLLAGKWAEVGKILYGDSIESLRGISQPIDLFINDSDHSAEYELAEYRTIQEKLSANAIVLGDNSHCSNSLYVFARQSGRRFLYFAEQPREHWYPGGGIGISFPDSGSSKSAGPPGAP